eukprot:SAG31_NODE_29901_length_388_cov_0.892734_1_plen_129_part_11
MEMVTVSCLGAEPLIWEIPCSASMSNGELRNLQLIIASSGVLTLTSMAVAITGLFVNLAAGASLVVSESQLISHDGDVTEPFPCNGADMECSSPHDAPVQVVGPASINTAAPLVCADEAQASCISGYPD